MICTNERGTHWSAYDEAHSADNTHKWTQKMKSYITSFAAA